MSIDILLNIVDYLINSYLFIIIISFIHSLKNMELRKHLCSSYNYSLIIEVILKTIKLINHYQVLSNEVTVYCNYRAFVIYFISIN